MRRALLAIGFLIALTVLVTATQDVIEKAGRHIFPDSLSILGIPSKAIPFVDQNGTVVGTVQLTYDSQGNMVLVGGGSLGTGYFVKTCSPDGNSCWYELACNSGGAGNIPQPPTGKMRIACNGATSSNLRLQAVIAGSTPFDLTGSTTLGASPFQVNGVLIGTEPALNLVAGPNISLAGADDGVGQRVNVTVSGANVCQPILGRLTDQTQASVTDADLSTFSFPTIPALGRMYKLASGGAYGVNTTDSMTLKVTISGTTVCSFGPISTSTSTSAHPWNLDAKVTVRATGVSGTVTCDGDVRNDNTGLTGLHVDYPDHRGPTTVDLSGLSTFATHVTFSASAAANTVTESSLVLEQCDPSVTITTSTTTSTTTTTTTTTTTSTTLPQMQLPWITDVQPTSMSSANRLTCVRFPAQESGTFTRFAWSIVTLGGTAPQTCGVGLYPDDDNGTALFTQSAGCSTTDAAGIFTVTTSAKTLTTGTIYRLCACATTTAAQFLGVLDVSSLAGGIHPFAQLANTFATVVGFRNNGCTLGVPPSNTGALSAGTLDRPITAFVAP